jgi:hypothetical protein
VTFQDVDNFYYKKVVVLDRDGKDLKADDVYFLDNGPYFNSDVGMLKTSAYAFVLPDLKDTSCFVYLPRQSFKVLHTGISCDGAIEFDEHADCTMN